MDNPLLLLFGFFAISTLVFTLDLDSDSKCSICPNSLATTTRNFCRDPEMMRLDGDRERQRAVAEAVVRNMDAHELVAIASRRMPAAVVAARRLQNARVGQPEQPLGVSEETRMSFVKMRAGKGGYPIAHRSTAAARASADGKELPPEERNSCKQVTLLSSAQRVSVTSPASCSCSDHPSGTPLASTPKTVAPASADVGFTTASRSPAGEKRDGDQGPLPESAGNTYSDDSCSVCLDDYEEGDELLQITCGHVFHRACVDLWLKAHCLCPCCRTDLNQLAQMAQVFPDTNRRVLQDALISADGSTTVAVDLLLNRRDDEGRTLRNGDVAPESGDVPPDESSIGLPRPAASIGAGQGRGNGIVTPSAAAPEWDPAPADDSSIGLPRPAASIGTGQDRGNGIVTPSAAAPESGPAPADDGSIGLPRPAASIGTGQDRGNGIVTPSAAAPESGPAPADDSSIGLPRSAASIGAGRDRSNGIVTARAASPRTISGVRPTGGQDEADGALDSVHVALSREERWSRKEGDAQAPMCLEDATAPVSSNVRPAAETGVGLDSPGHGGIGLGSPAANVGPVHVLSASECKENEREASEGEASRGDAPDSQSQAGARCEQAILPTRGSGASSENEEAFTASSIRLTGGNSEGQPAVEGGEMCYAHGLPRPNPDLVAGKLAVGGPQKRASPRRSDGRGVNVRLTRPQAVSDNVASASAFSDVSVARGNVTIPSEGASCRLESVGSPQLARV